MGGIVRNIFSIRDKSLLGRDRLIDFLRGGAMILVLLHHSGFPLGSVILAFHMPLFFVLSGYLEFIVDTQIPFIQYFKKRFVRLVVPYLTFELANLIIWCIKCKVEHNSLPGIESVISIITCINNNYHGLYGRLWFLPCMFVANMYIWIILRWLRNNRFALFLSILFLFALSFVTVKLIPFRLPFTIDTALFAAAFIMFGYVFSDVIHMLINIGNNTYKVALMIVTLLYLHYAVFFTDAKLYMNTNSYGEFTVSICAAIAGIITFLIIGGYLYRAIGNTRLINDCILWYGKNSLVSFPVHLTIKMFILWYVPALSKWYLLFIAMLIINIPIVNIITHYLPFMLGRCHSHDLI